MNREEMADEVLRIIEETDTRSLYVKKYDRERHKRNEWAEPHVIKMISVENHTLKPSPNIYKLDIRIHENRTGKQVGIIEVECNESGWIGTEPSKWKDIHFLNRHVDNWVKEGCPENSFYAIVSKDGKGIVMISFEEIIKRSSVINTNNDVIFEKQYNMKQTDPDLIWGYENCSIYLSSVLNRKVIKQTTLEEVLK